MAASRSDSRYQTIGELAAVIGTRAACAALGRSRATYYRRNRQSPARPRPVREQGLQPRALSEAERAEVLDVLHQERFVDQAPASIYANLLDEGRYLCSVPTMYRVLGAENRGPRAASPGYASGHGQARALGDRPE